MNPMESMPVAGHVVEYGLEARYEKYRALLKNFTIMNDIFMRNVLKKRECTEFILQVILDKQSLTVVEQVIQKDYKNLQGRSAILDCVVRDADGKRYDVEIQQDNEGASPKRARYHSGLMDMNTLDAGKGFDQLPESYVIFITRDDVLGYHFPIYHINRVIEEAGERFSDESHIIYVNSKVQDNTKLGCLMHDLYCKNADEMYSDILAGRVRELKETEKGVNAMCREMDEIYNEGIEIGKNKGIEIGKSEGIEIGKSEGIEIGKNKGIEIGKLEMKQETVLSMAKLGMPVEQIAKVVKESVALVQKWIADSMATAK